jgi:hypothetical protein
VPATGSRAELLSLKKVDDSSAEYFGWSCMSWRQPIANAANTAT